LDIKIKELNRARASLQHLADECGNGFDGRVRS
jgi:MerR family mercuric resistance operon transcriptional regulator